MIRASRRAVLGGAVAVPTLSGLAAWRWRHGEQRVLLHDPALEAGRRFAAAASAQGANPRAIEGDRVRFTRKVLEARPALVAGVSRYADLLLIADVAREAGYIQAATLHTRMGRCANAECHPGWASLGRLGKAAGAGWAEALAAYAVDPRGKAAHGSTGNWFGGSDRGLVLGWVLAPRG